MRIIKIIAAITIIYVLFSWFNGAVMWATDQKVTYNNRVQTVLAYDDNY